VGDDAERGHRLKAVWRWAGRAIDSARPSAVAVVAAALLLVLTLALLAVVRVPRMAAGEIAGVAALGLAVAVLWQLRFRRSEVVLIAAALVLYGAYFSFTSYGERNHDGPSHFKYIEYVATHGALPSPSYCFVCHHPPAYYLAAAGVYRFCRATRLVAPASGIQLLSLVLMLIFIIYAVSTIKLLCSKRRVVMWATALIVFWPYTFLNSVRLHNDIPLCTLMAAGLFYLTRYHQDERRRDIWIAAALAVLSVLTKSSGYMLVVTVLGTVAYQLWRSPQRRRLLWRSLSPLLGMIAALVAFTALRRTSGSASLGERVLGTAFKISPRDFVGNEPFNYLYFDFKSFLSQPFLLSRHDGSGRQFFWNHLIKSSLFATHNEVADLETTYRLNRRIAEVMNFLALGMLGYLAAGLAFVKARALRRYLPLLLGSVVMLAFIIAFKALIPSAHHNDFRFVYPLVIGLSFAYALTTEFFLDRRLLFGRLGQLMAGSFALLSVVYFLPKYDLVVRYMPRKVFHKTEQQLARIVPEKTPWDRPGNLILAGDELVEMSLSPARMVRQIDISADNNDVYRITLFGQHETREVTVGPLGRKGHKGLARYRKTLDPPVEAVRAVRVWPTKGDHRYSLGHLIVE